MSNEQPAVQARHQSLDIMRGFGVMGILAMNIIAFAMPEMAYINPVVYGGHDGADFAAWAIGFIFVDGKMRGLFSVLFGASMMLIIGRANENQLDPAPIHYRRMVWLGLFGLVHFYFIWWGDILFLYAVAGSLAYLFHHLDSRQLIKWALIIYAAGFMLLLPSFGSMFAAENLAKAPGAGSEAVAIYNDMLAGIGGDRRAIADEIALHRASYSDIVTEKLTVRTFEPLLNPLFFLFETLPFMLLGMAMLNNGFLLGAADAASYRRWAVAGIGAGTICTAIGAYAVAASNFDLIQTLFVQQAAMVPPQLLMVTGYAAAMMIVIRRWGNSAFMARVAAAGRAAFTNYIGTSIIMTSIFYGYGLGLYGHVGRAELYLFVLGAWIMMLLWSKPWLAKYRYGPLEWLWRSLARGAWQPFRVAGG